jgi:hypothetical protein
VKEREAVDDGVCDFLFDAFEVVLRGVSFAAIDCGFEGMRVPCLTR